MKFLLVLSSLLFAYAACGAEFQATPENMSYWGGGSLDDHPERLRRLVRFASERVYTVSVEAPGIDESFSAHAACEPGDRLVAVKCESLDFDIEKIDWAKTTFHGGSADIGICQLYIKPEVPNRTNVDENYGSTFLTITCTR